MIVFRISIIISLFLGAGHLLQSQSNPVEICDNAIDDDGNGWIDFNDPACDCELVKTESLIPNPSFEEQNCCPGDRSQMDCADDWIQASEATTDYLHTCDWLGWDGLPPPLPFPDGEGCIGFRDGRFGRTRSQPGWKEYTGACLTEPLIAGSSYRFEFYIGFTQRENSPPIDVTFFGATDCDYLPFGIGDEGYGCPLNGPGWQRLSSVVVSGDMEWKLTELEAIPNQDIYAIAIGPPCQNAFSSVPTFYFFDNLILASEEAFNFKIEMASSPCDPNLTLKLPRNDTVSYQWYKDGVALLGENGHRLSQLYGEGKYMAVVQNANIGCKKTPTFSYSKPLYKGEEDLIICEGESYSFGNQLLDQSGLYIDTFQTVEGCDSIVTLNLEVFQNTVDTVVAKIFPQEYYQVDTRRFYNPGEFYLDLTSSVGCDSSVVLKLDWYNLFIPNGFTPNGDGINDIFSVMGGEDVIEISNFTIFNRWGNVIYQASNLIPNDPTSGWDGRAKGKMMPEGVYVFTAEAIFDDKKTRIVSGSISLVR